MAYHLPDLQIKNTILYYTLFNIITLKFNMFYRNYIKFFKINVYKHNYIYLRGKLIIQNNIFLNLK